VIAAEAAFINIDGRLSCVVGLGARDSATAKLLCEFFGIGTVRWFGRRRPHSMMGCAVGTCTRCTARERPGRCGNLRERRSAGATERRRRMSEIATQDSPQADLISSSIPRSSKSRTGSTAASTPVG